MLTLREAQHTSSAGGDITAALLRAQRAIQSTLDEGRLASLVQGRLDRPLSAEEGCGDVPAGTGGVLGLTEREHHGHQTTADGVVDLEHRPFPLLSLIHI